MTLPKTSIRRTACAIALIVVCYMSPVSRATAPPVDFGREVQPILSENCFSCHGPDKHKGNLRLDSREGAMAAGKSGEVAVVPAQPAKSELVRRIESTDADEHMPPADSRRKLTAAQVEALKRWVAEGAEYKGHWAFIPPVRPALPEVTDAAWPRNPIDRFVLARLEREGLKPSPEADRVTLLRRLSLDLIGLPPTIDEVDSFVADHSPDAYEKQVDRLLASPHYGERWGRHWLDAARYADSDGFEKDKPRYVWVYRDYVINAYNRDLPYDQFIVEQLAGDQLPGGTQDQVVATGFLRNAMVNEEGGIDPEEFRMEAMFDRMDCVGKSVLGLTIQCAQCHNHKYDPLQQVEYYKMFAFLNNDHEAQQIVYAPDELMRIADLRRQMREIDADLRHRTADWPERMDQWERDATKPQPHWTVVPLEPLGEMSQRYLPQPDGSYLAQGYAPTKMNQQFRWTTQMPRITAVRLELLPDPNLPAGGPGRSLFGTCALTEFAVESGPEGAAKLTKSKIASATADFDQPVMDLEANFYDKSKNHRVTGPARFAIDGDDNTAWGINAGPGRRNVARKAVFELAEPIENKPSTQPATQPTSQPAKPPSTTVVFSLKQNHGGWNSDDLMTNNIGRFRLSVTADAGPIVADPLPQRVRDLLAIPRARRTDNQKAEIFAYWRTTVPEWKEANERAEALWKQWPLGQGAFTLKPRADARPTYVLERGDMFKKREPVQPGVPAFLNPLPKDAEPTRLTFAKWLVDRNAPTTARVFMNRMWQTYFGTGLVATAEDFGLQSELPSHPQLMDWLAVEFMEPSVGTDKAASWSLKHMHRLVATSATYRQSSRVTPELYAKDPYNRLLARGPRFRVEGEIVHDVALAASGLLNPQVGGRSVMPPAPAFVFQPPASYAPFPWVDETDVQKYRRAIYTFRRRSTPFPALQTFDVPNAESSCVRRLRSNSPLQALVSLNEPTFVECAQALARVTIAEGGETDERRLTYAFRRALAREPREAELQELVALLTREEKRFAEGSKDARELVPADGAKGVPAERLAAYTIVSRVILNLDETITKE